MKAGLVYKEVNGNDLLVISKAKEKEVIVTPTVQVILHYR